MKCWLIVQQQVLTAAEADIILNSHIATRKMLTALGQVTTEITGKRKAPGMMYMNKNKNIYIFFHPVLPVIEMLLYLSPVRQHMATTSRYNKTCTS